MWPASFGLDAVSLIGEMTLAEATEKVRIGFKSSASIAVHDAEGMVGRPVEGFVRQEGFAIDRKTQDERTSNHGAQAARARRCEGMKDTEMKWWAILWCKLTHPAYRLVRHGGTRWYTCTKCFRQWHRSEEPKHD